MGIVLVHQHASFVTSRGLGKTGFIAMAWARGVYEAQMNAFEVRSLWSGRGITSVAPGADILTCQKHPARRSITRSHGATSFNHTRRSTDRNRSIKRVDPMHCQSYVYIVTV